MFRYVKQKQLVGFRPIYFRDLWHWWRRLSDEKRLVANALNSTSTSCGSAEKNLYDFKDRQKTVTTKHFLQRWMSEWQFQALSTRQKFANKIWKISYRYERARRWRIHGSVWTRAHICYLRRKNKRLDDERSNKLK